MSRGSTALHLAHAPCVRVFLLIFLGLEAKGLLDFQGQRGITSIVRWHPCPVIFGVDHFLCKRMQQRDPHKLFGPILGSKRGIQTSRFWSHEAYLVYVVFLLGRMDSLKRIRAWGQGLSKDSFKRFIGCFFRRRISSGTGSGSKSSHWEIREVQSSYRYQIEVVFVCFGEIQRGA